MKAPVYEIQPQQDPRWGAFLESDPRSSVFHTNEWLDALQKTYRYSATVFTPDPPGSALTNGILLCRIHSRLTGSKLVSLPFSDHCEPLISDSENLRLLLSAIRETTSGKFKYAEIRPRFEQFEALSGLQHPSDIHALHVLDLHPGIDELHSKLHKDSIQRKIRRAERERVVIEQGRSNLLVMQFFELQLLTRRRHGLPPQPLSWFQNLVSCLGDRMNIYVANIDGRPIASILTLRHKRKLVYKYGCSDERFHSCGGMPYLFWRAIQDAKLEDLEEFDLGRSELENAGLIRFKDHMGAARTTLSYWQLLNRTSSKRAPRVLGMARSSLIQNVLSRLPDRLFRLAGEIFYRHAG